MSPSMSTSFYFQSLFSSGQNNEDFKLSHIMNLANLNGLHLIDITILSYKDNKLILEIYQNFCLAFCHDIDGLFKAIN